MLIFPMDEIWKKSLETCNKRNDYLEKKWGGVEFAQVLSFLSRGKTRMEAKG